MARRDEPGRNAQPFSPSPGEVRVPLHVFAAYGIELEYMLVDRQTLAVRPIADDLLRDAEGRVVAELARGRIGWSNELVLHVLELKNALPEPDLASLADAFQVQVREIDRRLEALGARLMPGGMHPWMDPARETRLWPHENAAIYQTYERIFDCHRHGFANLQSQHLNLPFADDAEFARLHAAVRLLLPILPALAASSPFIDGRPGGLLDNRLAAYFEHQARLPTSMGRVVPDNATCRAAYEAEVFDPMYRELAQLDPEGLLRHEWLNARGAIPRFERMALEVRLIDAQECPQADLAIAALSIEVIRGLYEERRAGLAEQQAVTTADLAAILAACSRDAERAVIDHADYLRLLDYPGLRCRARDLWLHLIDIAYRVIPSIWRTPLNLYRDEGPLARRILRATGKKPTRGRLDAVYRALCDCLAEGRLFMGLE